MLAVGRLATACFALLKSEKNFCRFMLNSLLRKAVAALICHLIPVWAVVIYYATLWLF